MRPPIGSSNRLKKTFAVDPDLNSKIDETVSNGDESSRSQVVNTALSLYFSLNDEPVQAH